MLDKEDTIRVFLRQTDWIRMWEFFEDSNLLRFNCLGGQLLHSPSAIIIIIIIIIIIALLAKLPSGHSIHSQTRTNSLTIVLYSLVLGLYLPWFVQPK